MGKCEFNVRMGKCENVRMVVNVRMGKCENVQMVTLYS